MTSCGMVKICHLMHTFKNSLFHKLRITSNHYINHLLRTCVFLLQGSEHRIFILCIVLCGVICPCCCLKCLKCLFYSTVQKLILRRTWHNTNTNSHSSSTLWLYYGGNHISVSGTIIPGMYSEIPSTTVTRMLL